MGIFAEYRITAVGMFTCLGLSIFVRIFLGTLYNHMIKEADNMATTNNRLLKQCKIKFSNCYEMNDGISNIPVFVDKFINRLSLGVFSFEMLYHLSGQLMLLSVLFSGIGVCRSIMDGHTLGAVLPFYIVSFAGLYLYFSVSTVVDVRGKKRVLRIHLIDYLENHLSPRMHVTRQDIEHLYGGDGPISDVEAGRNSRKRVGAADSRRPENKKLRRTLELMPIGNRIGETDDYIEEGKEKIPESTFSVTAEELEALLKEFLTG